MSSFGFPVWRPLGKPELGMTDSISDVIRQEEWRVGNLFLAATPRGSTLFVASDYGGEHKGASFHTFSFLVTDLAHLGLWERFRKELRSSTELKERRMGFKGMTDRVKQRSLEPFLRYANAIPGVLATFALNNEAKRILADVAPEDGKTAVGTISSWKAAAFQKLSCVGQLGAMLVAGLSAPDQDLIWVSDEDAIAPNREKLCDATQILGIYLSHALSHNLGRIKFGTAATAGEGNLQIEDLASIADFAAGSLAELFLGMTEKNGSPASKVFAEAPNECSHKTRVITNWLAEDHHPLRKIQIVVEGEKNGSYSTKFVRLISKAGGQCDPRFDWRAEVGDEFRTKLAIPGGEIVWPEGTN